MSISWNGNWLKCGQQTAELYYSIDRSVVRLFYVMSQSQKQTFWTFTMMRFSVICNCHDLKLTLLLLWTNWLAFHFVWLYHWLFFEAACAAYASINLSLLHYITWEQPSGEVGKFCFSFVANLLQYLSAKNYQNVPFDKGIAKIKMVHFLPHSIDIALF